MAIQGVEGSSDTEILTPDTILRQKSAPHPESLLSNKTETTIPVPLHAKKSPLVIETVPLKKSVPNVKTKPPAIKHKIIKQTKALNDDGSIYAAYGFLDVLNLGLGVFGIYFGARYSMEDDASATADMYEWLSSAEGLAAMALGLLPMALFAAFANAYYNAESAAERAIYLAWQAFRDAIKGIKNAFRALASIISTAFVFGAKNLSSLLMPVGCVVALMSVAIRLTNRRMIKARKTLMDDNKKCLEDLDNWGTFREITELPQNGTQALRQHARGFRLVKNDKNPAQNGLYYIRYNYTTERAESIRLNLTNNEIARFLSTLHTLEDTNPWHPSILQWRHLLPGIAEKHYAAFHESIRLRVAKNQHSRAQKIKNNILVIVGGLIDGAYMFMALILLSALPWPLLVFVAAVSVFYSIACSFTHFDDERGFQRNLIISQQKGELALSAKQVEVQLAKLIEIQTRIEHVTDNFTKEECNDKKEASKFESYKRADEALNKAMGEYNAVRKRLHESHKLATHDALLAGLRHARMTYTGLVGAVFAASLTSTFLFSTALPALVTFCTAVTGILLLVGYTIYALNVTKKHQEKQKKHFEEKSHTIALFIQEAKNKPHHILLKEFGQNTPEKEASSLLALGLDLALPVYYLMSWADLLRAAPGGLSKGEKLVNAFLHIAKEYLGDINNIAVKWILTLLIAPLCLFIWGGRSLAKYHKELFSPEKKEESTSKPKEQKQSTTEAQPTTISPEEAHKATKETANKTDSTPNNSPYQIAFRLTESDKNTPQRHVSDDNISKAKVSQMSFFSKPKQKETANNPAPRPRSFSLAAIEHLAFA